MLDWLQTVVMDRNGVHGGGSGSRLRS